MTCQHYAILQQNGNKILYFYHIKLIKMYFIDTHVKLSFACGEFCEIVARMLRCSIVCHCHFVLV